MELFSKSKGSSKGIWVICGIKKFRFSSTSYLLKNKDGVERWNVIEKGSAGKFYSIFLI
jgi:hypothetical protein